MKKYNLVFMGDSLTAGVYSDGMLDYRRGGYAQKIKEALEKEDIVESYYNIAVPGFTAKDLVDLLEKNYTYNENIAYNITPEQSYRKANYRKEQTIKLLNPDRKINEIIKDADKIIMTIGSNDIILYLSTYKEVWEKLNISDFKKSNITLDLFLESVIDNFKKIINNIRKCNSNVQIVFIGSYTPQKYNIINNILDKYLKRIEDHIISQVKDYDNHITWISIRDIIQEHKEIYLDNILDVHLNDLGYEVVADKVLEIFKNEFGNK